GEFQSMEDFQVTDKNILIYDGYLRKILVYDLSGNFQEEVKSDYHGFSFYMKDKFVLYYFGNSPQEDRGYSFIRTENGDITGYAPIVSGYEGLNYASINGLMYDPHREQVIFKLDTSYEIAVFDNEGYLV